MDDEVVLTRDRGSGRVHKRVRLEGRLMVDERCQTDQSGAFAIIGADALAETDPEALCRFCFPSRAWPEPADA